MYFMAFNFRYTLLLLLFGCQYSDAQKDSLSKIRNPKFEVGVIPVTLFTLPYYSTNKNGIFFAGGLECKYYVSTKNTIRSAFAFSNSPAGETPKGASQYDNEEKIRQYSVGFQHSFFMFKKTSVYLFTDVYYQTFRVNGSTTYSNSYNPSGYIQTSYDSTMYLTQRINSFNLVMGVGIKFIERKHLFILAESGLGLSYYTGTQQTNGNVASSYSNTYVSSTGVQYTISPSRNSAHQIPVINTPIKSLNLNGSIIRIALGIVF